MLDAHESLLRSISILLVELSKLLAYFIFELSVKFHYMKETHMMLVGFWSCIEKNCCSISAQKTTKRAALCK